MKNGAATVVVTPRNPIFLSPGGNLSSDALSPEICPTYGNNDGLINIMLATGLVEPTPNNQVATRIKAVAHLRMTAGAAASLRDTIDKALLLGAPVENPEGPAN